MINTISWKTYFVFMCMNFAFVPVVYWTFPETNAYKLETMDAIFAEAHEKGENPVWTERSVRKRGGGAELERRHGVENGSGSGVDDEENGGGSKRNTADEGEKEEIF